MLLLGRCRLCDGGDADYESVGDTMLMATPLTKHCCCCCCCLLLLAAACWNRGTAQAVLHVLAHATLRKSGNVHLDRLGSDVLEDFFRWVRARVHPRICCVPGRLPVCLCLFNPPLGSICSAEVFRSVSLLCHSLSLARSCFRCGARTHTL